MPSTAVAQLSVCLCYWLVILCEFIITLTKKKDYSCLKGKCPTMQQQRLGAFGHVTAEHVILHLDLMFQWNAVCAQTLFRHRVNRVTLSDLDFCMQTHISNTFSLLSFYSEAWMRAIFWSVVVPDFYFLVILTSVILTSFMIIFLRMYHLSMCFPCVFLFFELFC